MKRKTTHFIPNWKNVISLTFIVLFFGNFIAQTNLTPPIVCSGADTVGTVGTGPFDPGQPSGPVYNGPVASTVTCTPVGNDYTHDYQLIKHYKNYDNQPVKTLQIALHIFRDNYGNFIDDRNTPSTLDDTLIWQQDDSTDAYVQKFEGWINEIYAQLAHSSEVYASPIFYSDSKIRVKVMKVYYYNNTTLYYAEQNTSAYLSFVDSINPESLVYLPVFIHKSFGIGYASMPAFQSDNYSHYIVSGITTSYAAAAHIAHEIGHNLDLNHLYNEAPLDTNNVDWVDDLFNYNDFWCVNSATTEEITNHVCYDDFQGCDPFANNASNHCTNNLMAAVNIPYDAYPQFGGCCHVHITPSQIAKMHRAAQIKSVRKYVWGYSTIPYEVTKNETWDFSIKYYQDIVVKQGATLTIKCDLQMVPQAKIIVEKGATLFIDGGRIRNAVNSNDFWQGIEVYGDASLSQTGTNQGTVIMRNGASIENAQNAIRVWEVDNWSSMGGIVNAYDSYFINNRRSVEFMPYSSTINNVTYPNKGYFYNCQFYWDDSLMSEHPANAHVTLYKVERVQFIACDFEDRRTNLTEENSACGIFSIDAKYKVLPFSTVVIPANSPQDEYYNETNYDVCTFKRLRAGVQAMGTNSQKTITVDRSKFIDCRNGIILSQVDNAMLTRNQFEFSGADYAWMDASQIDIVLDRSTAYQVEGNIFSNPTSGGYNGFNTCGVMVENGGSSANQVFKNKTNKMSIGMHSFGQNKMQGSNTTSTGLQFKCNDYGYNHLFDEYTYKDQQQLVNGIRYMQGNFNLNNQFSPYIASGNTFSSSIDTFGFPNDRHIMNVYNDPIRYVYKSDQTHSKPTAIEGGVTLISTFSILQCPSSFSSISVGVGNPVHPVLHQQLTVDFDQTNNEFLLKQGVLNNLLALGDNVALHVMVACLNPFTKYTVKALLELNSPYLSESLVRELADKSPTYYPSSWLKDLIIANIELTQNPDFVTYLSAKSQPMSEAQITEIKAQMDNFSLRGKQELDLLRLKTEKINTANILIKEVVQDSTGASKAAFQEWIVKRGDALAGFQLADDLLDRGEKTACSHVLDSLKNIANQLPEGQLKTELDTYISFKNKLLSLTDEKGILKGWDNNVQQQVIGYTKSSATYARAQAQNLLCFFTGDCRAYNILLPAEDKSLKQASNATNKQTQNIQIKENVQKFVLYPNPATNLVNVHIDGFENEALVIVYDISGREVMRQQIVHNNTVVDISSFGQGIYTVWVQAEQQDLGMQKLVIKQ